MKIHKVKLYIGILVLLAYTGFGILGLFQFGDMEDKIMINCPYAEGSYAMCENVLDHIKNWSKFSNIVFPSIFVFFLLGAAFYFWNKRGLSNPGFYLFQRLKYYLDNKKFFPNTNRIKRWLSFFENSPPVDAPSYI